MTEEMKFFIYLLECYAATKEKNAADVLKEWDNHNITQDIYDNYWYCITQKRFKTHTWTSILY